MAQNTVPPANPIAHAAGNVTVALHGWPPAITTAILLAGAVVVAAILHFVLVRIIPKRLLDRRPVLGMLVQRTRRILFLGLAVILLAAVVPAAPVNAAARFVLLHILSAGFIVLIGWTVMVVVDTLTVYKLSRRPDNIQADVMARKHVTQWQVLRRASHVLTILITLAAALMVFPAVRAYGVSLLASAGAAGLVVGLAARPVLSNLIAGIQIAITQPLRVEDAVVINGQWGWIEEITSTYVVVRIWNWQRMIVPLAWLLEQPFQNWTRDSSELIGTVHWNVDYTVPVDILRKKLDEIVHSTKLWSGKVVVLQVTHALVNTIELRALVSARNSGEAWDLRCYVREQMIAFLQAEYPHALPKQRLEIEGQPVPDQASSRSRADAEMA
ncbi:mechanosensitive ion channel family protein [Acidiphilium sp. AL]|uniref:Mechanosensitive ion channel family protein n=1 Tax=Acidiphilium iwatense TaxID=768198 RepID=A0ABS9DZ21_9PROT|nr:MULTISPECIES: mechanosensitive ion channel family protein [Acidiphilium]MCF3947405.1 mechanosensitive ion channel family protein [Acidiphilium iwatense]MCU4161708.1 mechanosensitive ion channel family protein [Acidiphilium sp. AL]